MAYDSLTVVAKAIANSKYCIAFTGAGVSAESGIPTFRGKKVCGESTGLKN